MILSSSPSVEVLLGQAAAHYRAGHLAEAERLYRQVLSANPGMARAQAGLGLVLYMQGRAQEAIAAFRQAVASEPGNSDLLYKLGNMLLSEPKPLLRAARNPEKDVA